MSFQSMDILLGAALGTLIGFIIALPAIVLEASRRVKDLPLLIDVHVWRGHKLKDREVFAIGLLLHLVIALVYGAARVAVVDLGWFEIGEPFSLISMFVFAGIFWVVVNVVVLPLLGLGLLGQKEGVWVWLETLAVLLIEASVLWMLIQYYQPVFFS